MFCSGSNPSGTNIPPLNNLSRCLTGTWMCTVWWSVISVNRISVTLLTQFVLLPTLWWPPGGRTASTGSATAAAMTRCTELATRSEAPEAPRSCSITIGSPRPRTFPVAAIYTTVNGHLSMTSRWASLEVQEPQPARMFRSRAYRLLVGRCGWMEDGRLMLQWEVNGRG